MRCATAPKPGAWATDGRITSGSGRSGRLGEPEKAARLLEASDALVEEIGASFQPEDRMQIDVYVIDVRARLDEEVFQAAWREGDALSLEQAVALAAEE